MDHDFVIEIGLLVIALASIAGIVITRKKEKGEGFRGIGGRIMQWSAFGIALPIVAVLAIEGLIDTLNLSTLIAALIGFAVGVYKVDDSKK